MQPLRVRRGHEEISVEVEFDTNDKETDLVSKIIGDTGLFNSIKKAGFVFDNVVADGTVGTVRELIKFLTYEGKRLNIPTHKSVKENIYSADWLKTYTDSVLYWQGRVVRKCENKSKSSVIPRYVPAFTPWKAPAE